MDTQKFDITKFEKLESSGDILKGGFSTAAMGSGSSLKGILGGLGDIYCPKDSNTNCAGGNCVAGCGSTSTGTGMGMS